MTRLHLYNNTLSIRSLHGVILITEYYSVFDLHLSIFFRICYVEHGVCLSLVSASPIRDLGSASIFPSLLLALLFSPLYFPFRSTLLSYCFMIGPV